MSQCPRPRLRLSPRPRPRPRPRPAPPPRGAHCPPRVPLKLDKLFMVVQIQENAFHISSHAAFYATCKRNLVESTVTVPLRSFFP
ncbi:hypothetical protein BD410DRAFT_787884 [Rickenella mellea]|uniref:Uncharacterized protein n=1 Tax=Rickenella mellea TaxID=50990 RepID=A0A4Y7Q6V3_9AGAM|nr:hypothetical protein BD410DRAFT_787884 [Rickenella mellea]